MRIIDFEQRSEDWLTWRQAGLGSSDAAIIYLGEHFGRTVDDLLAEKRGETGRRAKKNAAMQRGIDLEPEIRKKYESWTRTKAEPLCAVHDEHSFLKASMDGYVYEKAIVVEIKAPRNDDHTLALEGLVPEKYEPQMLHLALVSGSGLLHYVSYSDRFEGLDQFVIVPYTPQRKDLLKLLKLELDFWEAVQG